MKNIKKLRFIMTYFHDEMTQQQDINIKQLLQCPCRYYYRNTMHIFKNVSLTENMTFTSTEHIYMTPHKST